MTVPSESEVGAVESLIARLTDRSLRCAGRFGAPADRERLMGRVHRHADPELRADPGRAECSGTVTPWRFRPSQQYAAVGRQKHSMSPRDRTASHRTRTTETHRTQRGTVVVLQVRSLGVLTRGTPRTARATTRAGTPDHPFVQDHRQGWILHCAGITGLRRACVAQYSDSAMESSPPRESACGTSAFSPSLTGCGVR